jgi:hypothetical protein
MQPHRLNPIKEAARMARPYWTVSRQVLIKLYAGKPSRTEWIKAVHNEYCPYGYAGHYGANGQPDAVTGWTLTSEKVTVEWLDTNKKHQTEVYSWGDFSEEIADLIRCGEWGNKC